MKRIFLALTLAAAMIFQVACGPTSIQKAVKASNELAGDTASVIQVVKTLYESQAISLAVKDKLADALIKISDAGIAFNKLVMIAAQQPDGGKSQIPMLAANFEAISQPFLEFLSALKLLSPAQNQAIAASIAALQVAIIVLATSLKGAAPASTGRFTNRLIREVA
jgi:hypothetical protein